MFSTTRCIFGTNLLVDGIDFMHGNYSRYVARLKNLKLLSVISSHSHLDNTFNKILTSTQPILLLRTYRSRTYFSVLLARDK